MEEKRTLVAYCGVYCGACPKYVKGKCKGCKGGSVGWSTCKAKPCCEQNSFSTCAECKKFQSVEDCKEFYPLIARFGEFISQISRKKGIEMIKENGEGAFLDFMISKKWQTMKRREK